MRLSRGYTAGLWVKNGKEKNYIFNTHNSAGYDTPVHVILWVAD